MSDGEPVNCFFNKEQFNQMDVFGSITLYTVWRLNWRGKEFISGKLLK